MPKADEPRVTVRLSTADKAVLEEAAARRNVKLGTLIRNVAVAEAERIRSSERAPRISRRPAVPVPSAAPVSRPVPAVPGVTTARELAMARQRRLNEGKS